MTPPFLLQIFAFGLPITFLLYFIIKADREIDTTVLCNNLPIEDRKILVATNQLDLDCEDLYGSLGDPRINSDVRPEDLGENC